MKKFGAVLILGAITAYAASAKELDARSIAHNGDCRLEENVTMSVSFNGMAETVSSVREKLDDHMSKISKYGDDAGFEGELKVNNQSYNIYTQMNNGSVTGYNYNGSASYKLDDAIKAEKLMEHLTKNNMQASINVNKYNRGNCN